MAPYPQDKDLERVRLNALQLFTSCTPIWSGKVCTPIFLEWKAVHSNIFGVDTFPLQKFSLTWSKQSCTQSSLQKFGVHPKSTPKCLECTSSSLQKFLECTSSPLQKFWSAIKVHSKKIGLHNISLQKSQHYLECTTAHSNFFGVKICSLLFFGVDRFSLHFFFGVDTCPLQNVGVHVVKFWSAFSLTLWKTSYQ
jgi:hypothetical protein